MAPTLSRTVWTRPVSRVVKGKSSLVYVYDSQLDYTGHGQGCDSWQWRKELAAADTFAQQVRSALPRDAVLLVVADHGMIDVAPENRVDLDAEPALTDGLPADRWRVPFPSPVLR